MSINVDTNYPFSDNVKTTITTDKPFDFYVRVPSWVNKRATIKVGNAAARAFSPDSTTRLQKISVRAGTTVISLVLSADITIETRLHGSVAVHRGPFNYALDLPRTSKLLQTTYAVSPFTHSVSTPCDSRSNRPSLARRIINSTQPLTGTGLLIHRRSSSIRLRAIPPSSPPSSIVELRP